MKEKVMKKIFYILVILLSTVILVSCINLTHEEIFNNIEIIYSEDDDKNNITDDFEFNYELNDKYEITFEPTSNAITINDNKYVVVTRSEEDQTAIVEVNIRYKGETVVFEYTFTILKLEHVVEEEVVIKFIVDDKTYQEVNVIKEQKVEKPIDPTKEGFNFLGWFLNEELFDFDQIVSSNLKLTAKWEEIIEEEVVIKFIVDDKTYQEVNVIKEQKVEKPIDPTKEGFNFLGWFLNEELFDFDQIVSSNLKLTAKWEKIIEEEVVIFRVDIND